MTEYNDEGVAIAPVVVRWVEALRSGNYKQARKFLHVGTGFCCLGVLEDLGGADWEHAGDTQSLGDQGSGPIPGLPIYSTATGNTDLPGPDTLEWAGISISVVKHLAEMNDQGAPFEDIADEIELIFAEGRNLNAFAFDPGGV